MALLTVNKNLPIFFLLLTFWLLLRSSTKLKWQYYGGFTFIIFLLVQQCLILFIPVHIEKTGLDNNFVGFLPCLQEPAFSLFDQPYYESVYFIIRNFKFSIIDKVGFWGIGIGKFAQYFNSYIPDNERYINCYAEIFPQAHNVYLGTFIELGWPGLISILSALFLPLLHVKSILKIHINFLPLIILLIFLIGMGFSTDIENFRVLWVNLGIIYGAMSYCPDNKNQEFF